jgi:hypothetical protein
MTPSHQTILAFYDALQDKDASVVASALSISVGTVYAVLRRHRPTRQRKPRPVTSESADKRRQILGLVSRGHKVARVAELVGVSRTYCYRVMAEHNFR